jgi:Zn-dependent oligopeptidase
MFPIGLQNKLDLAVTPLVSNNTNVVAGRGVEPTLISWDHAVTMFHEFGHESRCERRVHAARGPRRT